MRNSAPPAPQLQIVAFRLGSEEFGVDVFSVHEIVRHLPVTAVPRAPAFVEGVIELRGALVPVVDLRRRFELPASLPDTEERIMVVDFHGQRLGLVVDSVSEVLRIPESDVSDPPDFFKGLAAEYLRGIVRLPERLIILLDIQRILSSQERIELQTAELAPEQAVDSRAGTEANTEGGA